MRLVALVPVGPGEADRHLEKCLASAGEWADLVVTYGDNPDPATVQLIEAHSDVYEIGDTCLYEQGEHLVRNRLWRLADQVVDEGDMVCCVDADEEYAESPARVREILSSLESDSRRVFCVQFFHLWNEAGTLYRVDGAWRPGSGPRIARHEHGLTLEPLYETAWVCPPLPPHLNRQPPTSPILHVKHWSYACEKDRQPKVERYTRLLGHDLRHVNSIVDEHPTLEAMPCFS